jgi:hypothetical protein
VTEKKPRAKKAPVESPVEATSTDVVAPKEKKVRPKVVKPAVTA